MEPIASMISHLDSPKKIVITTHHKPDADALGSSLALMRFLVKKGHQVTVIAPSDYPVFLNWMEGNDKVLIYAQEQHEALTKITHEADVIFCLDFNSLLRIHQYGEIVSQAKGLKVMIDHHLEPDSFANYQLWDTKAAATAVLIYKFIDICEGLHLIDTCIAECLYAGIMTDTGSFRHPNTNVEVHEIVAQLIRAGINTSRIHKNIFDNNSLDKLKFLGFALSEKLIVLPQYHVAYFVINKEELEKYHSQTGDTEGLVNYALSLEGIVMACLMIERSDAVKLSFRSKEDFSVNQFARTHFEGGGHKNAAGGKSDLDLKATENKFLEVLPQYEKELINNYKIDQKSC
ncbi:MAG: bifunctional oligoribonuclease/PAP phosphatase NrnA [Cytophagales bacterium]|nr:MAG: bifunctional oligoribonuclease/PAP phosphatase NrnA [Cytophagales bacterium]